MNSDDRSLAEKIGLRGEWYYLRTIWDVRKKKYTKTERSVDGKTWEPYKPDGNTISIRYVGGPKDGKVEM